MIREITEPKEIEESLALARQYLNPVITMLGLTEENTPGLDRFFDPKQFQNSLKAFGERFFALVEEGRKVGFVNIGQVREGTLRFWRVVAEPGQRESDRRRQLVDFVEQRARQEGATRLRLVIVHENAPWREWFRRQGFSVAETKKIGPMPFSICIMEKDLPTG